MGPPCLQKRLLKHFSRQEKQTTFVAIGALSHHNTIINWLSFRSIVKFVDTPWFTNIVCTVYQRFLCKHKKVRLSPPNCHYAEGSFTKPNANGLCVSKMFRAHY